MMNPDKLRKFHRLQKLLSEGFKLEDGPIAPFLVSPSESNIIDIVEGNLAVLESGEVVPINEIYNPDKINLEGALFEGGRAYPMEERMSASRKLLEKIKRKQAIGYRTVLRRDEKND